MFFNFVFNSIDERDCFDVFIDEMICIDDKFIFDEFSNFVKEIESVFAEFEKFRHFNTSRLENFFKKNFVENS